MIGIVVGIAQEAEIAAGLGSRLALGGGTGSDGAITAARGLALAGVSGLLSFGLAGGLDPSLPAGAFVIPQTVVTASGDRIDTDPVLSARLGDASGTLFAADAVLASRASKSRVWNTTGALAVDLESGAVGRVAAEYRLPFAVLRCVCDPAHAHLPPAAVVALDAAGRIKPLAVLRSIASNPMQIPDLLRLARDSGRARSALRRRVAAIGSLDA